MKSVMKNVRTEKHIVLLKSKEIRHVILIFIVRIYPLVGGICMLVLDMGSFFVFVENTGTTHQQFLNLINK